MTTTLYTSDHEWLAIDGDVATVGITDYAQQQLGDVVFVELPKVGRTLKKAEAAAVVESVKAASDVYAPVTGEVLETNAELAAELGQLDEHDVAELRLRVVGDPDGGDIALDGEPFMVGGVQRRGHF